MTAATTISQRPGRLTSLSRQSSSPSKIRILHAVGKMHTGGIETWLMHVLRKIDRDRFQFDFLVDSDTPAHYDEEIRELGSTIHVGPSARQFWKLGRCITDLRRQRIDFDIVHSHSGLMGGFVLQQCRHAGIQAGIAHSHNDISNLLPQYPWHKRAFFECSRRLMRRYATRGLACSERAAESMFGQRWSEDDRYKLLHYGIDLSAFTIEGNKAALCRELEVPVDRKIIGHVGRFVGQKNHDFLLQIFRKVVSRDDQYHLVLVGTGPERERIEAETARLGLGGNVTFAGVRNDIPRLFGSLFDAFLFPSLFEGLGIVLIESQAAGCPAVISDTIPQEATILDQLVDRCRLSDSADRWADRIIAACRQPTNQGIRRDYLEAVKNSRFNLDQSVNDLTELYKTLAVSS